MRLKFWKRTASIFFLATPLVFTPGCGVELAVIGAAASAASQGSAAYKQGKLVAAWMGPFDLVVAAGEIALGDLGYAILESSGDALEGDWKIVAADEDGDKVMIKVDRKTRELTQFQIDVTWFGKEPTARLILKRMAVAIDIAADQDGTGDVVAVPAYLVPPPEVPMDLKDGEAQPAGATQTPESTP